MTLTEFHFEYAGVSSRNYGLIIANVNSSEFTQAYGTVNQNVFFNKKSRKNCIINDDYSDSPVSFEVDIISEDATSIDQSSVREIEKWLFKHSVYCKLYFDVDDDYFCETYEMYNRAIYRLFLNCRFMNPEKIVDNDGLIIGWTATVECDSNMFWQDPMTESFTLSGTSNSITVTPDTDDNGYLYPTVTITTGSTGGSITIINTTDDATRQTKFNSLSPSSVIVMNSELNMLTSGYYDKFVGMNFIRLLDGTNNFSITGNVASIKFTYNNRRMF